MARVGFAQELRRAERAAWSSLQAHERNCRVCLPPKDLIRCVVGDVLLTSWHALHTIKEQPSRWGTIEVPDFMRGEAKDEPDPKPEDVVA